MAIAKTAPLWRMTGNAEFIRWCGHLPHVRDKYSQPDEAGEVGGFLFRSRGLSAATRYSTHLMSRKKVVRITANNGTKMKVEEHEMH